MRQLNWFAALGAILLLAGCGEQGEVYDRPPEQVRELLRTVEVPLYMYGDTTETNATVDSSDPQKIVWKVTADNHPLMKFTATLQPEEPGKTRVVVDVAGANVGKFRGVEQFLVKAKEIRALYLVSMTEAVDSTLDGRPFDITKTYPALMSATAANAQTLFRAPSGHGGTSPAR